MYSIVIVDLGEKQNILSAGYITDTYNIHIWIKSTVQSHLIYFPVHHFAINDFYFSNEQMVNIKIIQKWKQILYIEEKYMEITNSCI